MATSAGSLAVWTEPRMKVQLQKLLKLSELTARTRVATGVQGKPFSLLLLRLLSIAAAIAAAVGAKLDALGDRSATLEAQRSAAGGAPTVVSPVQRLLQEDEGRLKLKDGELTMVPKKKKCKNFAEWERGFLRILCEAPAEARDDLMDFVEWARTIAAEFSFYHFSKFYEHLVRQVQRSATGISLDGYDRVWRVYKQMAEVKEKVKEVTKKPYSWKRDLGFEQPKQTAPEDAGGGRGKGKGAGAAPGDLGVAFRAMADALLGEMATAAGGYFAQGDDRDHGGMRHERGRTEGWHDVDFLVRRESGDGHIFLAGWRLPLGVIALGMVEKFLGVLLDTSGEVCTASIDEERIAVVVQKAGDLRAQAARGMVARRRLESLLGLLAFCSHVVWGLSLYTRRGFSFLTATTGRRMVRLPRPVLDDLSVLEQVKFDGHNAWGNLPFSIMFAILKNFLKCKRRQQWGTSACFLVPVWDGDAGWELVKSLPQVFRVVREWGKGTHLFTAPDLRGHGRTAWGPTRWPVVVVRVGPEPVALPDWA
ncbi:hypothetical protein CYMTET_55352 [Cymbomonas tetramitiformis]|uniref:Uncharacterized protein n=1 Tax=Cymbomonas tetramitiformis TaxID=36881 RepID=A0AAE0BEI5_9CHLO|nr:hypothetical protein CYMTET_55352 [Cymbomonas tetramitiformis]